MMARERAGKRGGGGGFIDCLLQVTEGRGNETEKRRDGKRRRRDEGMNGERERARGGGGGGGERFIKCVMCHECVSRGRTRVPTHPSILRLTMRSVE